MSTPRPIDAPPGPPAAHPGPEGLQDGGLVTALPTDRRARYRA